MDNTEVFSLGTTDLVVFSVVLAASMVIGLFHAFRDRKKKGTDNYYFGDRKMSSIPVGLSTSVTFISAITVIGFPTEVYGYGNVLLWYPVAAALGNLVACVYYIPLIHKLKLNSIFMYLEMRFNRKMRLLGSVIAITSLMCYYIMAIYTPALALSAVTPISIKWTIFITSVVCVVYTTLGGIKAVVWTDTAQALVMFIGALGALIKSANDVGGLDRVWEAIHRGDRLTASNFRVDPTYPYTVWAILIGQTVTFCQSTCIDQAATQRYLSCKSVRGSRLAVLVSLIPTTGFYVVAALSGCVMYAYFEGCDPLKAGTIAKPDQLMPYMVMQVFKQHPGLTGLFVSAAFSGALSTVSSGINSCGSLILRDFVLPCTRPLSDSAQLKLSKIIVFAYGMIVMCLTFCVEYMETTVVQFGFVVCGCLGGPALSVFTLGMFFPWCTTLGAFAGQLVSTIFMSWVALSAKIYGRPSEKYSFIPTSTEMCQFTGNETISPNATSYPFDTSSAPVTTDAVSRSAIQDTLFAVTFLYYSVISSMVATLVALAVSVLTGPNKPEDMDPRLFVPLVDNKILPAKTRKFFRLGVPEESPRDEEVFIQGKKQSIVSESSL